MSLSGVIKSTNDISCVLYPQDYLASLKKRFPEFIQNTDEELMAILKNAPVRKEIEYEMDFTLAELKRILHESTVENKSEDIDKRLGSLSPTRNERIQLLLGKIKLFVDQEGKDVYQDSIIHEKLDKIIQYLENKNKLSNKSTKYFYEDDARPHPRGRFDLYPDITIDGVFEKIPYNIEYSLMLRPPYYGQNKYQDTFLLAIEYREGAKRNRRNDINGYLTRDLAQGANELALDFCTKESYAIVDYYSSYPNLFCLVKKA